MRIAIVQLKPIKGNIEKNIEIHVDWIKKALTQEIDMIVFPELSLTGYEPGLAESLAINPDDRRLDCFQQLSNDYKITLGVGVPTRQEEKLFISMILFQPEKIRITYSKQHLYPTEVSIFTPGETPLILDYATDRVAPAICYELSNKAHYAYAAQQQATVYLASVLNSVGGVDADLQKLSDIARTYKMFTFMSNFVGQSGGYDCAGKSTVWNKKGEVIRQLGSHEEGFIVFDTVTEESTTVVG